MPLLPLLRALHIAATLLIAGACAFEFLILRRTDWRSDPSISRPVHRWLHALRVGGVVVALPSWAAWLALLAVSMSGLPASQAWSADVLRTVVTRTTFGHVWLIRVVLFAFITARLAWSRPAQARQSAIVDALDAAASAGLVCSLAWTGHALGTHPAHLLVDAIHLLAATAWLGMIPPLWLVVRCAPSSSAWSQFAVAAASRFFLPGVTAVAVLAATGIGNSVWLLDSAADLLTTKYGVLLAAKVLLFIAMLALATVNRRLTRRLPAIVLQDERRAALSGLRTSMLAELVCGAVVIALVGWLGVTAPTAHEHVMHQMHGM